MCLCVLVCVNFGDEIFLRGKNGKMIITIIINCHNGSGKLRKFSRSWMTKQTTPLNLSCEM